ncbi:MAG: GNAT family N-acetyltransferase [Moraxellaceae bacterium]|nr:GNAT family N-acetyltransferase [Moraxellaceae bacterium]
MPTPSPDSFCISPLHQHPGLIPELARRHHPQWADVQPLMQLSDWEKEFTRHARTGTPALPTTVVALDDDGTLLGSASLVHDDMDGVAPFSPWLANVLVAPAARGRGVGAALMEAILEVAAERAYAQIYLFTEDQQDFYARRGWTLVEVRPHHGKTVSLMTRHTR